MNIEFKDIIKQYKTNIAKNLLILEQYKEHPCYEYTVAHNNLRTIFDHFLVGNTEYVVTLNFQDGIPNITGYTYDNNLNNLQDIGFTQTKYCNYILYSKVHCNIPNITNLKYNVTISALFFHENNNRINQFLNYYRARGVDRFILYYNAKIAERSEPLPIYTDVEYIEWNYKFNAKMLKNPIDPTLNQQWAKHTYFQDPQLIIALKKYTPFSKYTLFIDMDEWISVPGNNILSYLDSLYPFQQIKINTYMSILSDDGNTIEYEPYCTQSRSKIVHSHLHTSNNIYLHNSTTDIERPVSTEMFAFHIANFNTHHKNRGLYLDSKIQYPELPNPPIIVQI